MKQLVKIVGSTLIKSPRDLDIVMVIPDKVFKKRFGLSATQWAKEGDSGQWSKARWVWSTESIRLGRLFERRINKALSHYPLDFKIIPESEDKRQQIKGATRGTTHRKNKRRPAGQRHV